MLWTTITKPTVGLVADTMLLLTDGSVLFHQYDGDGADGSVWMRLSPADDGSYESGKWSGPFKMLNARLFFASGVLADGRVYAVGGEYCSAGDASPLGEVFNPTTNTWASLNKPTPAFDFIKSDVVSCVLDDGRVLFGSTINNQTALWDPVSDVWTEAGTKFGAVNPTKMTDCDEETWTLLPDGSVLTVEVWPRGAAAPIAAQRYLPATDEWVDTTNTLPNSIVLSSVACTYTITSTTPPTVKNQSTQVSEIGPALLLYTGKVFAIGANGHTGLYDPATDTWTAGPDFLADTSTASYTGKTDHNTCTWTNASGLQGAVDAPAVLLPGGQVLCSVGNLFPSVSETTQDVDLKPGTTDVVDDFFSQPSTIFEYDPTTNKLTAFPASNQPTGVTSGWKFPYDYKGRFLLLPNGKVLYSDCLSNCATYTPSAAQLTPATALPVITNAGSSEFPSTLVAGSIYSITGTGLNGASQANSYGDDAQMATNFPLVKLTQGSRVAYCHTFNFKYMGVDVTHVGGCDFEVPSGLPTGMWTLVVVANGIASLPVSVKLASQACYIHLNHDTFSIGEIRAHGTPAIIEDSVRVVVEGFTRSQLGLGGANPDWSNPPQQYRPKIAPIGQMSFDQLSGPVLPDDPASNAVQSFTFIFSATFADETPFANAPNDVTINAKFSPTTGGSFEGSAIIHLILSADPYILHEDINGKTPWYLSTDVRVFSISADGSTQRFGSKVDTTKTPIDAAYGYLSAVLTNLNPTSASLVTEFENINPSEAAEGLSIKPTDSNGNALFNFALARVRLQDKNNDAADVRVFFRLWASQQINSTFDATTTYRSVPDPNNNNLPIMPLLGIQDVDIITIPFFGDRRVDTATQSMTTQTDALNKRSITHDASGAEVVAFFGCWLDVNQPDNRFPASLEGGDIPNGVDGPFNNPAPNRLFPITQWLRGPHHCLVAQVAYDLDPIKPLADTGSSDKLAQRNLTFVDIPNPGIDLSRRASQTFEVRPSPSLLLADQRPDELVIEWGNTPAGSTAQIYLPNASSADILNWADQLYALHTLTAFDSNTVQCQVGSITRVPIPQSGNVNLAGLITLDLPAGVHKGDLYEVSVQQVTSVEYDPVVVQILRRSAISSPQSFTWRKTIGGFGLSIPVSTKSEVFGPEEDLLAILRWIAQSIPITNRWYSVFNRYLAQTAGRVKGFGGNPVEIVASPGGATKPKGRRGKNQIPECCSDDAATGKVEEIIFDQFGDFEGFTIKTRKGECIGFLARERRILQLIRYAWIHRVLISVVEDGDFPRAASKVIFRTPPPALD